MKTKTDAFVISGRRHFLKTAGLLLPLPLLGSLLPSGAKSATQNFRRWSTLYFPMGMLPPDWEAVNPASNSFPPHLNFLSVIAAELLVLKGLSKPYYGKGDHESATGSYLACSQELAPGRYGRSADQIAAATLGAQNKIPLVALSPEGFKQSADGFHDVETGINYLSWVQNTKEALKIQNPMKLYEALFGAMPAATVPAVGLARAASLAEQSILDFAQEDAKRALKVVSGEDKVRIQEYFDAIRDAEKNLAAQAMGGGKVQPAPAATCAVPSKPKQDSGDFNAFTSANLELLALALQCNLAPISTYILDWEFSDSNTGQTTMGHHTSSHHGGDPEHIAAYQSHQAAHFRQFSTFVKRLGSLIDADGSRVLDNTIVLMGSGLSDGNVHRRDNIPTALAGGKNLGILLGRSVSLPGQNIAGIHKGILTLLGVPAADINAFAPEADPVINPLKGT